MGDEGLVGRLEETWGRIPQSLRLDNGSDFTARVVKDWLKAVDVRTLYIEPGSPWENGYVESFNGTLRDECLNVHWFDDLTDARRKLQAWQREYNEIRPHRSLNELSPQEFKARWTQQRQKSTDWMDQYMGSPHLQENSHMQWPGLRGEGPELSHHASKKLRRRNRR